MTDLNPVGSSASAHKNIQKNKKIGADNQQDWTIKGLPAETVESTRAAARSSGMKINAWVGRALAEAASDVAQNAQAAARVPPESADQYILEELAKLRQQNEALRQTVDSMNIILLKMCAERL